MALLRGLSASLLHPSLPSAPALFNGLLHVFFLEITYLHYVPIYLIVYVFFLLVCC